MRQVITTAVAVFLALFSAQVHAGTSAEGATESHLEQVLKAAGWTMTPERAATYGVGDIYKQGETDAVIYGTKCFEATPQTGKVEGFEIIKLLEGGLRLPLVGRIGVGTKKFKKQTFGEPYADKFDDMDLESISEKCRAWLLRRSDLSDLYLIKSVLMANMRERICEDKSAGVSTGGVGVEGRTSVDCVSGTEGHVAVGYKLVSVREVLGMGGTVPTSTPAGPAPKPQSGVGQAMAQTGGSADYATLAAQAARAKAEREQMERKERQAQAALEAERQRRVAVVRKEILAKASADFKKIRPLLGTDATAETRPILQAYLKEYETVVIMIDRKRYKVTVPEVAEVLKTLHMPSAEERLLIARKQRLRRSEALGTAIVWSTFLGCTTGVTTYATAGTLYLVEPQFFEDNPELNSLLFWAGHVPAAACVAGLVYVKSTNTGLGPGPGMGLRYTARW